MTRHSPATNMPAAAGPGPREAGSDLVRVRVRVRVGVRVRVRVRVKRVGMPPVEVEELNQEAGHHMAHVVRDPAGAPELRHGRVH